MTTETSTIIIVILTTISSIFTILSTFLTLIIVIVAIYSTRRVLDQMRINTYENITGHILAIDQIFISEPDLRPYFYEGKELSGDLGPLAIGKIMSMSEYFTDLIDDFVAQQRYVPGGFWPAWKAFIIYLYEHSPAMTLYLERHPDWYTQELLAIAREARRKVAAG